MMVPVAVAVVSTCGQLKDLFRTNTCCGNDAKAVTGVCPYNFDKPLCAAAGVQAPRDLSTGATGTKVPKIPTLNEADTLTLPLANVHYHLGAEHKSDAYSDGAASAAYDAANHASGGRRLSEAPRPGWMCPTTGLTAAELQPYDFVHCQGTVSVGKSYEFHYVHSSAGYTTAEATAAGHDGVGDGLGGAANGKGLLNPYLAVQAQVFLIVNDAATSPTIDKASGGWKIESHTNAVMYPGSTTGTSHDNTICSPYAVTWHVDKACHKISAASFDKMCHDMKTLFGLEHDLAPHGSRKIVDAAFVVPAASVKPLA